MSLHKGPVSVYGSSYPTVTKLPNGLQSKSNGRIHFWNLKIKFKRIFYWPIIWKKGWNMWKERWMGLGGEVRWGQAKGGNHDSSEFTGQGPTIPILLHRSQPSSTCTQNVLPTSSLHVSATNGPDFFLRFYFYFFLNSGGHRHSNKKAKWGGVQGHNCILLKLPQSPSAISFHSIPFGREEKEITQERNLLCFN